MNCKPGDLAVVVRSASGESVGLIVRCIRLSCEPGLGNPDGTITYGPVWETDNYGPTWDLSEINNLFMDADLRPIRDPGDDAVDETLLWLPSPTKELA